MFGEARCIICEVDCEVEEFKCRRCESSLHFTCALGFEPPDELKLADGKIRFLCPTCVVGTSYNLLHQALDAHSRCQAAKLESQVDWQPRAHSVASTTARNSQVEESASGDSVDVDITVIQSSTPKNVVSNSSDSRVKAADFGVSVLQGSPSMSRGATQSSPAPKSVNRKSRSRRHKREAPPPPQFNRARSFSQESSETSFPEQNRRSPDKCCQTKAKSLSYILNTLIRLPGHPNTLLIGDSHLKYVDGKDVDPTDDQVRIRSVGGLCIVGTALALSDHKYIHRQFKRVGFVLGTNDCLHGHKHWYDDRLKYHKLLYQHARRIFPNAQLDFVMPFTGLKGVSEKFLTELADDLKYVCPDMMVIHPPSVLNKINKGGVHLAPAGKALFMNFLRSKFVTPKQRMFPSDSGRVGRQPISVTPPAPYRQPPRDYIPAPAPVREDIRAPARQPYMMSVNQQDVQPSRTFRGQAQPPAFSPMRNIPPDPYSQRIVDTVMELLQKQHNIMFRPNFYAPMPPWSGPPPPPPPPGQDAEDGKD